MWIFACFKLQSIHMLMKILCVKSLGSCQQLNVACPELNANTDR